MNDAERKLVDVFGEVLKVNVGLDDSFFHSGGDSILALQVVSRAKKHGLRVTPKQLFASPTARGLARVADPVAAKAVKLAQPGTEATEFPLAPIQRWFFDQVTVAPHHWNQSVLLCPREPLDLEVLEAALGSVIAHHDALRLTFRASAGEIRQRIEPVMQAAGRVRRIALAAEDDFRAALSRACTAVQADLDLAQGPLFRAAHVTHPEHPEGRLLLACHHLAVDGVSWRILLEDLQSSYTAWLRGEAPRLPEKTTSYERWVRAIHTHAQRDEVRRERGYWERVLAGQPVLDSGSAVQFPVSSTRVITRSLTQQETHGLLHVAGRAYQTEIQDLLLAALGRTLVSGSGSDLVMVEGHGREELAEPLDVSRTVGWFTSVYPVRVPGFEDVGENIRATRAALRGVPHKGMNFGVLRHLVGEPSLLQIDWSGVICFNYLGQFDQTFSATGFDSAQEEAGHSRSPESTREHAILINALVFDGQLHVDVDYSELRSSAQEAEGLVERYLAELRRIVEHCCPGVAD